MSLLLFDLWDVGLSDLHCGCIEFAWCCHLCNFWVVLALQHTNNCVNALFYIHRSPSRTQSLSYNTISPHSPHNTLKLPLPFNLWLRNAFFWSRKWHCWHNKMVNWPPRCWVKDQIWWRVSVVASCVHICFVCAEKICFLGVVLMCCLVCYGMLLCYVMCVVLCCVVLFCFVCCLMCRYVLRVVMCWGVLCCVGCCVVSCCRNGFGNKIHHYILRRAISSKHKPLIVVI